MLASIGHRGTKTSSFVFFSFLKSRKEDILSAFPLLERSSQESHNVCLVRDL